MNVVNQRWYLVMILDSLLVMPYREPLFTTTITGLPCVFRAHALPSHTRELAQRHDHMENNRAGFLIISSTLVSTTWYHLTTPLQWYHPRLVIFGNIFCCWFWKGADTESNRDGLNYPMGPKKDNTNILWKSFATNFNQFNLSHPFQRLYSHLLMICILQCCLFPCSVATSLTALRVFSSSRGGLTRCCPRSGGPKGHTPSEAMVHWSGCEVFTAARLSGTTSHENPRCHRWSVTNNWCQQVQHYEPPIQPLIIIGFEIFKTLIQQLNQYVVTWLAKVPYWLTL